MLYYALNKHVYKKQTYCKTILADESIFHVQRTANGDTINEMFYFFN